VYYITSIGEAKIAIAAGANALGPVTAMPFGQGRVPAWLLKVAVRAPAKPI
jgi:hypothetical protein